MGRPPRRQGGTTLLDARVDRDDAAIMASNVADSDIRGRGLVALLVTQAWIVVLLWWTGSPTHWPASLAAALNDLGRLTGLLGTYLVLVQLLLRSHVPWLVEAFGKDTLRRGHTVNAYLSLGLLGIHGIFQTIGYALDDRLDFVGELVNLSAHYDGVFLSIVGLLALAALTGLSIERVRHRIPWPTWRVLHLAVYVAVALSVPHQLATGSDFVQAPLAVAYWWSLYLVVVGAIVVTRLPSLVRAARESPRILAPLAATVFGAYLLLSVRVLPVQTDLARPAPSPSSAAPSARPAIDPAPSRSPGPDASGTFTGDVISTPYGDAQVSVVLSAGRLTDVEVVRLPDIRKQSAAMSASVEPYLERRAIAAQGAQFDVVSGATYTSLAYKQSLESALRAAGVEQ